MEVVGVFALTLLKTQSIATCHCPFYNTVYLNQYKSLKAILLLSGIVSLSLGKHRSKMTAGNQIWMSVEDRKSVV